MWRSSTALGFPLFCQQLRLGTGDLEAQSDIVLSFRPGIAAERERGGYGSLTANRSRPSLAKKPTTQV